jgi:hypothetical protein
MMMMVMMMTGTETIKAREEAAPAQGHSAGTGHAAMTAGLSTEEAASMTEAEIQQKRSDECAQRGRGEAFSGESYRGV